MLDDTKWNQNRKEHEKIGVSLIQKNKMITQKLLSVIGKAKLPAHTALGGFARGLGSRYRKADLTPCGEEVRRYKWQKDRYKGTYDAHI